MLIYKISYKTLIGAEPSPIRFNKVDGFTRVYDGARYLILENMMPFTIGLDLL